VYYRLAVATLIASEYSTYTCSIVRH